MEAGQAPPVPAGSGEDTLTGAELQWVLERHGGRFDAAELIDEIKAHRDSTQYEPGAPYRDPEGNLWIFGRALGNNSAHWLRPGLEGPFEYATPRRPLRRLVPQGSSLSNNERDLVHADLGMLLDLLGLGDYARPESSHEVFLMCLEAVAKLVQGSPAP
jgi:hypothetical protein